MLRKEDYPKQDQEILSELQEYWRDFWNKNKNMPLAERRQNRQHYNEEFSAKFSEKTINRLIEILESVAKQLIGSSISFFINDQWVHYKIAMVEIYADGIWDSSGDFIKAINRAENSLARQKILLGPRIYYYNGRIDIKAFDEYLPFSFLIRNYFNENGNSCVQDETIGNIRPIHYPQNFLNILNQNRLQEDFTFDNPNCPAQLKLRDKKEILHIEETFRIINGHHVKQEGKYGNKEWNFRWIKEAV